MLANFLLAANRLGKAAGDAGPSITWIVVGLVVAVFGLILLIFLLGFLKLYIQSIFTGAGIGIFDMIGMRLRQVDLGMIVRQKIALVQAGVRSTTEDLEAHYLARGNVPKTATAVIA